MSEQEPRPAPVGGAAAAPRFTASPAPRRQGRPGRHLLGRVLPDRRLQREDRGGGAGWFGASPGAAAGLWGPPCRGMCC